MRDILVFAMVFGSIPYILKHAYIGVLVWSWLSYMNPHRLTWGAAYDFPFAQVVAISLFISLLFDREKKRIPINHIVILWLLFIAWTFVSSQFAYFPNDAWAYLPTIIKIQLIIFIAMAMMGSEERIRLMIWVIFFSIGFFGIKGGIFTIKTAGGARIFGPAGSFIADNNHLAVAMLMVMPLGFYLIKHEVKRILHKRLISGALLLIGLSVFASYSRGAFLAIAAVSVYLWWKTPNKLVSGVVGVILLAIAVMFMPDAWTDRMGSIGEYQSDKSASDRLNSWQYAINVANARFTGGGLISWSRETFQIWAPNPDSVFVAHSIYFAVLADHGWVGLILFLMIFISAWRMAGRLSKLIPSKSENKYLWMGDLARMIQVSFVAYATGGAFLSLAYFDLPWHLVGIVVLLDQLARREGVITTRSLRPGNQLHSSTASVSRS